jgi:hypothetical protein
MDKTALLVEIAKAAAFYEVIAKAARADPEKYRTLFDDDDVIDSFEELRKELFGMMKAVLPAGKRCSRCQGSGAEP